MARVGFDPLSGITLLGELALVTAPAAGREEICDQGLAVIARALGAAGGAVFMMEGPGGALKVCCQSCQSASGAAEELARSCAETGEIREAKSRGGKTRLVGLPLNDESGFPGALVLANPDHWDAAARVFAASAGRALGSALRASRVLKEAHLQGELLARRNVELEVLRELAAGLHEVDKEEDILQVALDLVLEKLALEAGWVLWGEASRARLELAASRGISEEFVRRAHTEGLEPCLCKDVFETGRLRFARNTTECPRMPDLIRGRDALSHACIPLKFERGTLGVMNIANRPGRIFSPEELQFLETVGNQVCLAVDKARTARAERRRNAEARALSSLSRAIGGSLEEKHVLQAVGDYTRDLLRVDRCMIFLGDSASRLSFAHLSGSLVEGLQAGSSYDLAVLGSRAFMLALDERKPLVIPDAFRDPRANNEVARRWNIGSAVIVPLISHEHLGGLLVAGREKPSHWNEDEVELAAALAGQAAVAMESARLFRQAQDALHRLQQAQYGMMRAERMAAVGTLASSLAHEVRNPLNSINLQLVLLARRVTKLGEGAQREVAELLDTARREITRLDGLVEEFLSLSTIDRISPVATQPEEIVREVLDLMAPVGRRTKGVMVTDEVTGLIPRVMVDREKFKQVLINLVRNAIEAMPDGGQVNIATRVADGMLTIAVSDTGPGIDPGLDVFSFFTTTKRGGTGLGLPIARRIVEAHGGSLNYESLPGRGTTFTILLRAK